MARLYQMMRPNRYGDCYIWCNMSVNSVGAGFTTIFSVATRFN
ncbi:hypothetical protein [Coleofasciculus sp. G2-EDA-02]